jgi:hypothetical protein
MSDRAELVLFMVWGIGLALVTLLDLMGLIGG